MRSSVLWPQRRDVFKHSEAFSFHIVTAADQTETDRYWNAIVGNGGAESPYCPKTRTSLKVLEFRWVTSQGYSKDEFKKCWLIDGVGAI